MQIKAKKTLFVVVGLGAALSLTACGTTTVTSEKAQSNVESAVAAITLAEEHTGGTAFELDDEDGKGWVVDVVIDNRVTEVYVNSDGSEVSRTRSDGRIDADTALFLQRVTIELADAITTASGEVVALVSGADLDRFRTTVTWDVEFDDGKNETTVQINATTGDVANIQRD